MKFTPYAEDYVSRQLIEMVQEADHDDGALAAQLVVLTNSDEEFAFYDEPGSNALLWAVHNNYPSTLTFLLHMMEHYMNETSDEIEFAQNAIAEAFEYAQSRRDFRSIETLLESHDRFDRIMSSHTNDGSTPPGLDLF